MHFNDSVQYHKMFAKVTWWVHGIIAPRECLILATHYKIILQLVKTTYLQTVFTAPVQYKRVKFRVMSG